MWAEERELAWVQGARAGDRPSVTLLLAETRQPLLDYIGRHVPPDLRGLVDAEDVVQEAFRAAVQSLARFQWRGPGSFYRWVATIAIRKLRDWTRSHRALRRGGQRSGAAAGSPSASYVQLLNSLASPGHTPSRSAVRLEAAAALHAALRELPADHRQAIELVYIQGKSVSAAAVELGRTERAVHQLCYRARCRLRTLLGDASRFLSGGGSIFVDR